MPYVYYPPISTLHYSCCQSCWVFFHLTHDTWHMLTAVWWLSPLFGTSALLLQPQVAPLRRRRRSSSASPLSCKTGLFFFLSGWEGREHNVGQQIRASCWLHIAWHKHTHTHAHTHFLNLQVSSCFSTGGLCLHSRPQLHNSTEPSSNRTVTNVHGAVTKHLIRLSVSWILIAAAVNAPFSSSTVTWSIKPPLCFHPSS